MVKLDDEDIPDTMVVPLAIFFEQGAFYDYSAHKTALHTDNYYIEQNKAIPIPCTFPKGEINIRVDNLLKLSLIISHYEIINHCTDHIKRLKLYIYLNYFLCWSYILIVSLPSLYYAQLDNLWIVLNIKDVEEPFTLINLKESINNYD